MGGFSAVIRAAWTHQLRPFEVAATIIVLVAIWFLAGTCIRVTIPPTYLGLVNMELPRVVDAIRADHRFAGITAEVGPVDGLDPYNQGQIVIHGTVADKTAMDALNEAVRDLKLRAAWSCDVSVQARSN